jgi:hypothetical protein
MHACFRLDPTHQHTHRPNAYFIYIVSPIHITSYLRALDYPLRINIRINIHTVLTHTLYSSSHTHQLIPACFRLTPTYQHTHQHTHQRDACFRSAHTHQLIPACFRLAPTYQHTHQRDACFRSTHMHQLIFACVRLAHTHQHTH